ncbi:MAG: TolC family protein [Desulfovibrio sp.]|nr:TolC family protein [Desulfovibrio sp.]
MKQPFSVVRASFRVHAFCVVLFFLLFVFVSPLEAAKKVRAPLGSTITMREAVLFALKANPTLGAAHAQARSQQSAKKAALGAFGPKLGLVYSAMKQVRKSEPVPTSNPERGTYSLGVEISQPVFQGFRLLANYQKQALQAKNDALAVKQTRLSTTESVQTSFISYLRASANVVSQKEAMERLADQLQITQAFYATGLKPKLDVLQAEVDFRESEQLLLTIQNTRDTEVAKLNTLLGLSATADTHYVGTLHHVPFTRSLAACIEKAYQLRPDVTMAALSVDIAKKDQMTVRAEYYPQIEAYYTVTNTGNTPDLKRAGENGSRYSSWEVGAKATWNVFQWGTTYHADQQAGHLVTKVRYQEQELRLQVGYEVKTKYLALREAEKRIGVAEAGERSAALAYQQALARYREQVGTGFDVLDTSAKLTQARFSLTSAYADYLTALAQLFAAMGEEHPDILHS